MDAENNIAVRALKKITPVDTQVTSDKFFVRKDGILYATSLLVALAIIEMTDLLFAIDSIPAILSITSDVFIVVTSNIFAIFGLRSLYFLLAGSMRNLAYLRHALIALLFFVGIKMLLSKISRALAHIDILNPWYRCHIISD